MSSTVTIKNSAPSSGGYTVQGTIDISDCNGYKSLTASDIRVGIVNAEGYNVHFSSLNVSIASYNCSTGIVTFNYTYTTTVTGRNITAYVCAFTYTTA